MVELHDVVRIPNTAISAGLVLRSTHMLSQHRASSLSVLVPSLVMLVLVLGVVLSGILTLALHAMVLGSPIRSNGVGSDNVTLLTQVVHVEILLG
jgi:TRAP-type mannitol/chloroaromatic compound transport system permease large subunit